MELRQLLHLYFLLLGSLVCLVLGKLILRFLILTVIFILNHILVPVFALIFTARFYSTIIFTDRNIFTYLNTASTVSLEVLVQTRVGGDVAWRRKSLW